jgi:hypothetical protein
MTCNCVWASLHVDTQAQGAAPLEQPGDNNTNQQLLLQNILQTYGQAGAQPAVRVPLRPAALHADIIGLNGNLNTIFQTLNGQVVSALPQFIAAQPTLSNAQAVLALQQQQQQQQQASDPDNSTQLAALLAAMEDPSSRWAADAVIGYWQGGTWSVATCADVLFGTETGTSSSSAIAVCTHAESSHAKGFSSQQAIIIPSGMLSITVSQARVPCQQTATHEAAAVPVAGRRRGTSCAHVSSANCTSLPVQACVYVCTCACNLTCHPSCRYVPGRAALQALGVADGKISKVQGAAASLAAASPAGAVRLAARYCYMCMCDIILNVVRRNSSSGWCGVVPLDCQQLQAWYTWGDPVVVQGSW